MESPANPDVPVVNANSTAENIAIKTPPPTRPEGEILLINKPLGWTSFQAVKKIKYITRAKKVGHAGTLDPLASGLLIICTEKQTKTIQSIQDAPKEYTGSFHIGAITPSYDLETDPCNFIPIDGISAQQIQDVAESFLGETDQIPPLFSAIKVDGKRAYKLARKGEDTVLKSRKIFLTAFDITEIKGPEVFFRIACSKGTYIRSIAHDFGQKLGCGAYLSSLVRTKIGDFDLINATTIQDFENARKKRPDFC
ncbi:MAG: hypothetical protein RLZZ252_779 [Bacteroidota bacterium]